MPHFEPFRGLRYDRTVPLDQVIAPPYDVIEPRQREELADRHPENSVLVELPESSGNHDRYEHAAELLESWQRRGHLLRDPLPSLYVYRMRTPEGAMTTGVVGALRLPEGESDDVRPHEETLAKPLGDRLHLLRATRANLSPIWLLSTRSGLSGLLPTTGDPTARAQDDDGVIHELWRIDDAEDCARIAAAVGSAPLVVADGHHRYQTALHYRGEEVGESGKDGAGSIMAYVVELSPAQLRVGAIHRVLRGLDKPEAIQEAARAHFNMVRAGPLADGVVGALETSRNLGLLLPDGSWLLTPRQEESQDLLDPTLVQPMLDELEGVEVGFAHHAEEAAEQVRSGESQAALVLRPVGVEQIARWATDHRRMPPKTTYFHPKPRTGMVFRLLDS
jgi:uncharacterized protein (DUF1015 family)